MPRSYFVLLFLRMALIQTRWETFGVHLSPSSPLSSSLSPPQASETKITYNIIKSRMNQMMYKLSSMKFEEPSEGEAVLRAKFKALRTEMDEGFSVLEEEFR